MVSISADLKHTISEICNQYFSVLTKCDLWFTSSTMIWGWMPCQDILFAPSFSSLLLFGLSRIFQLFFYSSIVSALEVRSLGASAYCLILILRQLNCSIQVRGHLCERTKFVRKLRSNQILNIALSKLRIQYEILNMKSLNSSQDSELHFNIQFCCIAVGRALIISYLRLFEKQTQPFLTSVNWVH